MAVPLASAFIRVKPEIDQKEFDKTAEKAGEKAGEKLADGVTRGADGRLRDSRGKFLKTGEGLGEQLGEGITRGADGKLRDANGRFVKAGEGLGDSIGRGLKTSLGAAGGGGGGVFAKTLATMAARITIVGSSAAAAAPGVAHLAAALAPAAGAAAALPVSLLAIKAASAVVKVAVLDVGDAISTGFGDDAKKAQEALDELSGSARVFAKEVIRLKPQLTDIQENISDRFFKPFADDVRVTAERYMPLLNTRAGDLAGSLGGLGEQFSYAARAGRTVNAVDVALRKTDTSVVILRDSINPLTTALTALVQSTAPELPKIAQGFVNISQKVGQYVKAAADSGRITQVYREGVTTLKDLGGILFNVGSIFNSVFQAAGQGSEGLLVNLRELTGQVATFLNSGQGQTALASVFGVLAQLGDAMRTALAAVLPAVAESMALLGPAIGGVAGPAADLVVALAPLLPQAAGLAATIITALTPALAAVTKFLVENEQVIKILLITMTAYNVAAKTMAIVTGIQAAGSIGKYIAATRIGAAVTRAWTTIQWAFNASMIASPIGITVAAIAALIAIVVVAYKRSDTFRAIVDRAWAGIKTAIAGTVDWFVNTAWPALKSAWDAVVAAALWLWRNVMVPAWEGIKTVISTVVSVVSGIINGFKLVIQSIGAVINWLYTNIFSPVFAAIRKVVEIFWLAVRIPFYALYRVLEAVLPPVLTGLQAVWNAVFNAIKGSLEFWWNNAKRLFNLFMQYVAGPVKAALTAARDAFAAVFNAIRQTISGWWNTYVKPIFTAVKDGWTAVSKRFSDVYNNNIKPVFEKFVGYIKDTVVKGFQQAVKWIGDAWDGVKDAAKKPVAFVVNQVINPFITGLNKAASIVGIKDQVAPITGFAAGGRIPGVTLGYASGGRIAGPPAATDNRQAMVSGLGPVQLMGGEFIVNAEDTRKALPLLKWINSGMKAGKQRAAAMIGRPVTERPGDGSEGWAFADGGLVGWVKDVWGALSNPIDTIKKPFENMLKKIPGVGRIKDFLIGSAKRLLNGVVEWFTGASGGAGKVGDATRFVQAQNGKPYQWAAAGPGGYDCSGIVSAVYNVMKGRNPHAHTFSTGSLPGPWFTSGSAGPLLAGWSHPGQRGASASVGHMAGQIGNLPFESRGSRGVIVGGDARRIGDFANRGVARFAGGGLVTPPLYDGGGRWPSGTLGLNASGHTEHVMTGGPGGDMDELKALLAALLGAVQNLGGEVADALERPTRRAVRLGRSGTAPGRA